ncbi:GDYXXLXY domain-containing protein [Anaerobacillus sp. MEB173]|uniref:GDYXXLXY domain-containing protein n=1 Tax=Anaerobacillus sp. MEB173 TaxID=3383345 RepID=UPI003F8F8FAE
MIKRRPTKWFFLALIVPVFVLTAMLLKPVQAYMLGDEIRLATVPLDPRDLFYGDYVILDLEIETVPTDLLDQSLLSRIKETNEWRPFSVYTSLQPGENNVYEVEKVSEAKPDGLFIKGEVYPYIHDERQWNEDSTIEPYVQISYGIDRFYVEEGTGLELEELSRQGRIVVTAKAHNGYVILTDIAEIE